MQPAFGSDQFKKYQRLLENSTLDELIDVVKQLNLTIKGDPSLGEGFRIGHSYFCDQKECTAEWLEEVVKYDLIPIIREYWFDNDKKFNEWAGKLRDVVNDE
jgi:5-methylcytosine-specific restriction protein B